MPGELLWPSSSLPDSFNTGGIFPSISKNAREVKRYADAQKVRAAKSAIDHQVREFESVLSMYRTDATMDRLEYLVERVQKKANGDENLLALYSSVVDQWLRNENRIQAAESFKRMI